MAFDTRPQSDFRGKTLQSYFLINDIVLGGKRLIKILVLEINQQRENED